MKNFLQRKSTRLKEFNYSANRIYFVTVCTKNRESYLGYIAEGKMHLSTIGEIAEKCWIKIPTHFPDIELMDFIIMPDHVHGILKIQKSYDYNGNRQNDNIGKRHAINIRNSHGADMRNRHAGDIRNRHACSLQLKQTRNHQKLPVVIGSFKSSVTRMVRHLGDDEYFAWQKSYYDRIIRNSHELKTIREYIKINPQIWSPDDHSIEFKSNVGFSHG